MSNATLSANLLNGAALVAAVVDAANAALTASETRATAKAQNESASAVLQRLAVMAVFAKEEHTIRETMRNSHKAAWDKAKGSWSGAENMAVWLRDGNSMPAGKVTLFAADGATVIKTLNASVLPILAAPRQDTETSLSSIIKEWRAVTKDRAKVAEDRAKDATEWAAAYLRSPEGAAAHPDADVETLRLELDPIAYAECLSKGKAFMAQEAAEAAEAEHVNNLSTMVDALVADMPNLPTDVFAALHAAVMERAKRDAAEEAARNLPDALVKPARKSKVA